MIVSCDNCGARYKLEKSKIAGRGAKITCPRCRNVFVVYKDGGADSQTAPPASVSAPPSASLSGLPHTTASASLDEAAEAPAPKPAPSPQVDVHSLDFRRVGVHTWKVKVKIGLVYDFSDFRTLSKYIAEGRVTGTDRISHDGSNWTEIGTIPNLEVHFVETWYRLDAEQKAAAAQEAADADLEPEGDFEDDEPTNIIGMTGANPNPAAAAVSLASFSTSAAPRILPTGDGDLASATAAALADESGPAATPETKNPDPEGSPRFVDPFAKRKRERRTARKTSSSTSSARAPAPRPASDEGGSKSPLWVVGAVALAAAGIWYFFLRTPDVVVPPPRTAVTQPPPGPTATDRKDLQDELREELENVEGPGLDEEPEADPWEVAAEPELRPVVPKEVRDRRQANAPSPTPSSGGGQATTARDHEAVGDSAARNGSWSQAASAYRLAAEQDPRNAVYNGKLGMALKKSGDTSGAMSALTIAAKGGYSVAWRELGDLSAQQGDTAGAVGYYQSYLRTSPRDAAEVQQKIDRANGG